MDNRDLIVDAAYDLLIEDGDFVIGDNQEQSIDLIVGSNQSEWNQYPLVGVGLPNYLNMPNSINTREDLKRAIDVQLRADDFRVSKVQINNLIDILIDAKRV